MPMIEERLATLSITLPETLPAVVDGYTPSFVPYVKTGNLLYLSGRLAKKDGKPWQGKLGEQLTTAEGQEAARGVAVELIATLRAAVGDLDCVKRIVRLLVLVNGTPDFDEPHAVANGASELLLQVFGERGTHARTAFCASQLPFGACVEVEMVAEL